MMSESALNGGLTRVAFIERTNPECQVSAKLVPHPMHLQALQVCRGETKERVKGQTLSSFHGETGYASAICM